MRPVPKAQIWMHNGFLQVEGEKMSKSLGNFFTINELMTTPAFGTTAWHGKVLRLAMLKTQYQQPIDWTADRLTETRRELTEWVKLFDGLEGEGRPDSSVVEALLDDLNTPQAITALRALARQIATSESGPDRVAKANDFKASLAFLGLWDGEKADDIYTWGVNARAFDVAMVDALIAERNAARAAKDWAGSDRIRDELAAMGIALKDGKDEAGNPVTTWEVKR